MRFFELLFIAATLCIIIIVLLETGQSSESPSSSSSSSKGGFWGWNRGKATALPVSSRVCSLQFKAFLYDYDYKKPLTHGATLDVELDFNTAEALIKNKVSFKDIYDSATNKNKPYEFNYLLYNAIDRVRAKEEYFYVGRQGTLIVTSHTSKGQEVEKRDIYVTKVDDCKTFSFNEEQTGLCVELRPSMN